MEPIIRLATDQDQQSVISILNHYIVNSMAAYPQSPMPVQAWDKMLSMCRDNNLWVSEIPGQGVVGFAMLKWYMGKDSFTHSAEVGYFIAPKHTGKGLGTKLLKALEQSALSMGITTLTANISSLNPDSLAFHERMGFTKCGQIPAVGKKHGQLFDIIWVYKHLQ